MLTQIKIQNYKSLFDVTIDLEPLTVFIGPNASGKSNICEASGGSRQIVFTGYSIANVLIDILLDDRALFGELEKRFIQLVPAFSHISLKRERETSVLRLVDKYSGYLIPAADISDGTLRILTFLVALYQVDTPDLIYFEEPENGVHPWLLHKMMELLNLVSTEGIVGKPVQVLITTHSPVLLNYVKPKQVRAVELDGAGKTQVHALPTESARFQAAMEAYDGELGELWFTNFLGGNPACDLT